jgi:iron complex transport system substrate-binding protein
LPSASGADLIEGTDSFLADVVKISGGDLVGSKGTKFEPLNPEALVSMNPDVILTGGSKTDSSSYTEIMSDPRFKTINAVKQNRVRPINGDVLLRRGTRVDSLLKAVHFVLGPNSN